MVLKESLDTRIGADPRSAYNYTFIRAGREVFGFHRHTDGHRGDHRHDYGTGRLILEVSIDVVYAINEAQRLLRPE